MAFACFEAVVPVSGAIALRITPYFPAVPIVRTMAHMTWKTIRLELAETRHFPKGSAVRAYLLRLPLDAQGRIEMGEMELRPGQATVRRYWPNEPDRLGHVVRARSGWQFRYGPRDAGAAAQFHLDEPAIALLGRVSVTEPAGERLPFRILRCEG